MSGNPTRSVNGWTGCVLVLLALGGTAYLTGWTTAHAQTPTSIETQEKNPTPAPVASGQPRDPRSYGLWVLVPAATAILLTILTRQVVAALFVGILVGAFLFVPCLGVGDPIHHSSFLLTGTRLVVEKYIIGGIHQTPEDNFARIKILAFTMFVAFTVGVILRNGGTAGMVRVVVGQSGSRRRGGLTGWLAGMVVFFDDYANCMILGPTLRSVFDRLKLSRAKLAYVINATASPDASLALIGTWIGAQLGFIQSGLGTSVGAPSFLTDSSGAGMTPMKAFIHSLPYRFYPVLVLVFVFLVLLLDRDFGPMRTSQNRALSRVDADPTPGGAPKKGEPTPTWWLGFFPILALVGVTLAVLFGTGMSAGDGAGGTAAGSWWERASGVLVNADSYLSILYGSLAAAVLALVLTLFARTCSFQEAMTSGLNAMAHTVPALTILILAWALSQIEKDLMLGQVLTQHLKAMNFPALWLPVAISAVAFLLSFATGTSWGTMALLCPITLDMAMKLGADLPPEQGLTLFYASVGSTLGGAIFGDHCSPISGTTVLASIGADCPHFEHVWTQLPYAMVAGLLALLCGDVLCSVYQQPWYYGWAAATTAMLTVVFAFGRPPKPSFDLIDA